jgi:rSAM/selenodomain-associated transferase 2
VISVIVPTLNEEAAIGACLAQLAARNPGEIVVADGGSADRTVALAGAYARVVPAPAGRGAQMNAGARASSGDVLLFLHADSILDGAAFEAIREAMRDPAVAGGNFDIRYAGADRAARLFTLANRIRRRAGIFYGDSGIFCRRSVFEALGGYRPWPLMEDYDFARRLRRRGRLALLDLPIFVSDRRWRRAGVLRTLWGWTVIQALYSAGVSPYRLARLYPHVRERSMHSGAGGTASAGGSGASASRDPERPAARS